MLHLFNDPKHALTGFSKIVNGSGCVLQSEVLTCVCISEGFPLPTVKWPFLKNSTDYSVFTTVSNHTVNSTVSLTVKNNGSTTLECVSNNGMGEAEEIPVSLYSLLFRVFPYTFCRGSTSTIFVLFSPFKL
uniref:Ig-like domain-containing protein n=1 Tax=Astatotilapia calliptera TaxID=8154 RepID=A0A3P8NF25_ASTCA